jgi:hypothetical protein
VNLLQTYLRQVVVFLFFIVGIVVFHPVEVHAIVTEELLYEPIPLQEEVVPSLPDMEVEQPYVDNVHGVTEPVADIVEETISTVGTVNEEIAEPIEQPEPIIEVVDALLREPVRVEEAPAALIGEGLSNVTEVIPIVDDLDAVSVLDPTPDQPVARNEESEKESDPPPVQRQTPNKPAALALAIYTASSNGSGASDYSGGSTSSPVAGIHQGEYLLNRLIIVTRNYANEFILYNQWSHAPPGPPPKQTLLNLIMDYKS